MPEIKKTTYLQEQGARTTGHVIPVKGGLTEAFLRWRE